MASMEKLKQEIEKITEEGDELLNTFSLLPNLEYHIKYQTWYSLSTRLIARVLPERLNEFKECYSVVTIDAVHKYPMCNLFTNLAPRNVEPVDVLRNYKLTLIRQLSILKSLTPCLDSHLLDIKSEIYYEYQEDELSAASEVMKINLRAAGAIAGVVLEKHLKNTAATHGLKTQRNPKTPGINELITVLSEAKIIDVPQKKKLELLNSIRNLCDHDKNTEPKPEQVEDLIQGAKWCVQNII